MFATSRRARRRRLPGRVVRREGGHGHPSRRPRPAGAPERRRTRARCGPSWQVLAELAARLGDETGSTRPPRRSPRSRRACPSTPGITHEEIGGTGVRWQEREAGVRRSPRRPDGRAERRLRCRHAPAAARRRGGLRLGHLPRSLGRPRSPSAPRPCASCAQAALELAPADAERLGVGTGDEVDVRSNGTSVRARVAIHERMRPAPRS